MAAASALRRMRSLLLAGVLCVSDGFLCLFLGSVQTREPHDESVDAVLKILVCECDLCNCILSASALMAHDHISFCSGASVWTTCYAPVGYAILNPQIEASWTVFDLIGEPNVPMALFCVCLQKLVLGKHCF